jgi:hypothetical protein
MKMPSKLDESLLGRSEHRSSHKKDEDMPKKLGRQDISKVSSFEQSRARKRQAKPAERSPHPPHAQAVRQYGDFDFFAHTGRKYRLRSASFTERVALRDMLGIAALPPEGLLVLLRYTPQADVIMEKRFFMGRVEDYRPGIWRFRDGFGSEWEGYSESEPDLERFWDWLGSDVPRSTTHKIRPPSPAKN